MAQASVCTHGGLKGCRDCRRASWQRYNQKRQERGQVGKACIRCAKVRTAEDGNHPGYCRECLRWWYLEYTFGITREQYEAKLVAQGNGCAICGRAPEEPYPGKLHVDHDHDHDHDTGLIRGLLCQVHDTRLIRGLLCQVCNLSLGKFHHDPALLRKAAEYLEG